MTSISRPWKKSSFAFAMLAAVAALHLSSPLASASGHTVVREEHRDGYICRIVEYTVPDGDTVRSFLLVPDGASSVAPRPGIVLLHDHGARFDIGKEKLARPMSQAPVNVRISSEQWVRDCFDGVYLADSLASLGYVVIVPDMLYWGGRSSEACRRWSMMKFGPQSGEACREILDSLKETVYEGQREVYDSLMSRGVVWAEKTLREDAAAAACLASLDYVDKDRIGVFGWSMGAHRAWLLAAFSPLVSTGVSLSWMTLKETQAQPYKASDYAMLIPRLRDSHDFPDIALLLAPKPYLFLSGTEDKLFPVHAVERAYARMQSIYSGKGAEGMLRTEFFEGGHHCCKEVQAVVVDFLEKNLTLQ